MKKILIVLLCISALICHTALYGKNENITRFARNFDFDNYENLGNIFLTTEKVRLPVKALLRGDSIQWKISDYRGKELSQGNETLHYGKAVIYPQFNKKGYFFVEVALTDNERTVAKAYTAFGVIEPAERISPKSRFGVATHFAQGWDTDIMPLIVKAGIGLIRDEHYWSQIERKRGRYIFPSKNVSYMADALKLGISPLIVMTYSNALYADGAPATPEARDAYARYGQAIIARFPDVNFIEVWNEYNGSWCGGEAEKNRPKYYAEMIKTVYQRLKAIRPDIQILGTASVGIPITYIENIFKYGGLPYMDAVVVHPYRERPEGVDTQIRKLRNLIKKYNNGREKPIWATECSSFSKDEYDWERGKGIWEKARREKAVYLVRIFTLLLSENCEKVFWYEMRDYPNQKEDSLGLCRSEKDNMGRYTVTPAYIAYANLIRQLSGADFARTEPTSKFIYIKTFKRGDKEAMVCWAIKPSHIIFKTDKPVRIIDIMGGEQILVPAGGEVPLELGETPVYVYGEIKETVEGR